MSRHEAKRKAQGKSITKELESKGIVVAAPAVKPWLRKFLKLTRTLVMLFTSCTRRGLVKK